MNRGVVVIVGGGFSGAAAAIHLSRLSHRPLDIRIVEPRAALGMGVAHSASEPDLRLNGPASIHAPYPDETGGFAEWLERTGELRQDPHATAASGLVFARRCGFGRYMASELGRHARSNPSGSTIEHIRQTATRATPGQRGVEVRLSGGMDIQADYCILALGWNEVGTPRELTGIASHAGWHGNPWHTGRFDSICRNAAVMLIGSGLTASDTFAVLVARGHQGPVISLSRRGLRPACQNPFRSSRSIWDRVFETEPSILQEVGHALRLREAVAMLREKMALADGVTSSWHVPFDEFRDAAWILWNAWTPAEKRQYLRHVKSWYDAFRFRNPPQTEAISRAGVERGQLGFAAGRIRDGRASGGQLIVDYESRQDCRRTSIRSDVIINCTGPQPRPSASRNPFWLSVLRDGVARDAEGGGVDVDMAGRLIDSQNRVSENMFAVGPPTIGRFAEATAVPYIVRGILEVVRRINRHQPSRTQT